jgi:hypothetical protein
MQQGIQKLNEWTRPKARYFGVIAAVIIFGSWAITNLLLAGVSEAQAIETKAKATRFVNYMHGVARTQNLFDPRHKLHGRQTTRRLGQQVIVLRHRHVEPGMHIQTDLDHRAGEFYPVNGILE